MVYIGKSTTDQLPLFGTISAGKRAYVNRLTCFNFAPDWLKKNKRLIRALCGDIRRLIARELFLRVIARKPLASRVEARLRGIY